MFAWWVYVLIIFFYINIVQLIFFYRISPMTDKKTRVGEIYVNSMNSIRGKDIDNIHWEWIYVKELEKWLNKFGEDIEFDYDLNPSKKCSKSLYKWLSITITTARMILFPFGAGEQYE